MFQPPLRCFWFMSNNFGDALNVYLVKAMTGAPPAWAAAESPGHKYAICGSILAHVNGTMTVWGAGVGAMSEVVPQADVRAVRGPLSRWRVQKSGGKCPEVYGDPAFLLPRFYTPAAVETPYRVGVIPHYVDHERAAVLFRSQRDVVDVINVLDAPEAIIDRIGACDVVVASSLHGLVAGIAYGKPVLWVEFSDDVLGDGTKFFDLFLSCEAQVRAPLDLRRADSPPVEDLVAQAVQVASPDLDALWAACPFREARCALPAGPVGDDVHVES